MTSWVLTIAIITLFSSSCGKMPKKIIEIQPKPKFDNPNYIRDRQRNEIKKPALPDWYSKSNRPFHPAWMDYCDPYHCNDYHKLACGLNRKNLKFKWFQSGCHIILNNQCANYRGSLKYDMVDTQFCYKYVMHLRSACPTSCPDTLDPVCGRSNLDGHVVIFKNQCFMVAKNCDMETMSEYDAVDIRVCEWYLPYGNTEEKSFYIK